MEGGEAGRRSRLISTSGFHASTEVSMCPAEDAQAALGPGRPGWTLGTEGRSGTGAGLSDGQGTPDTGPVLGILQAAGRQATALRTPAVDNVVVSLPGACRRERAVTGARPLARSRWRPQRGGPGVRHGSWRDACHLKLLCRPQLESAVGEVRATRGRGCASPQSHGAVDSHGHRAHWQRDTRGVPCFADLPWDPLLCLVSSEVGLRVPVGPRESSGVRRSLSSGRKQWSAGRRVWPLGPETPVESGRGRKRLATQQSVGDSAAALTPHCPPHLLLFISFHPEQPAGLCYPLVPSPPADTRLRILGVPRSHLLTSSPPPPQVWPPRWNVSFPSLRALHLAHTPPLFTSQGVRSVVGAAGLRSRVPAH